jgi:hypothetical protein
LNQTPQLFFNHDHRGLFRLRFHVDGVEHEILFKPRHGLLLLALVEAWQLDEGDHPASRGCRSLEQYARRVPQLAGDVAPLVEKSMDTYTYSIRAKVRKSFGFTPEARALSFAVVENVRGEGFRAGPLLREAQLCERNTEERRPA